MKKIYWFEAKNVEEAILKAANTLKTGSESLEIKSQTTKKGLLGLRGKRVRIGVVAKDKDDFGLPDPVEDLIRNIEIKEGKDRDGAVGIKNGKVIIRAPRGNGRFPVLSPGSEVVVRVNGIKISRPTVVTPLDQVEIELTPQKETRLLEIEVAPDRLSAHLTVYPPYYVKQKIQDAEPVSPLEIRTTEEVVPAVPVTVEEAYESLKKAGIVYGIVDGEVERAVAEHAGVPVLVAIGKAKVDGVDGYLDFLPGQESGLMGRRNEKLDYRDIPRVQTVEIGEIIARIEAPLEGEAGMTVTGEEIKPRPVKPAQYLVGEGVLTVDDRLVAAVSGRPALTGNTVEVLSLLVIDGDINLETGNVRFNGDVYIEGAVTPGMVIEAEGMVTVKDIVDNAEISARDGVVTLSTIVNSKIRAGGNLTNLSRILPCSKRMLHDLEILQDAVREVQQQMNRKKLEGISADRIVRVLIDNKLRELPKTARKILSICNEKGIKADEDFIAAVTRILNMAHFTINEGEDVQAGIWELIDSLNAWIAAAEQRMTKRASVQFDYALNSEIYATGEILVKGQGCFNTVLSAGESVIINGHPGVFRGGHIVAGGNVYVKELGAEGGPIIRISVPGDKKVTCKNIFGRALVCIGRQKVPLEERRGQIEIFEDKDGNVRFG